MNDLFDAMRQAIQNYMELDSLPPRAADRVKKSYENTTYNVDTVDSLIDLEGVESEEQ